MLQECFLTCLSCANSVPFVCFCQGSVTVRGLAFFLCLQLEILRLFSILCFFALMNDYMYDDYIYDLTGKGLCFKHALIFKTN